MVCVCAVVELLVLPGQMNHAYRMVSLHREFAERKQKYLIQAQTKIQDMCFKVILQGWELFIDIF